MRETDANRRGFYRVVYPRELRPVFVGAGGHWPVIDLSEGGMRVYARGDAILPSKPPPDTGDEQAEPPRVEGTLRLPDNRGHHVVAGVAVYRLGHSVGIAFDAAAGVPMPSIMAEQRLLIRLGHLRRDDPDELAALRAELGLREP
jgi:hypothetical protein